MSTPRLLLALVAALVALGAALLVALPARSAGEPDRGRVAESPNASERPLEDVALTRDLSRTGEGSVREVLGTPVTDTVAPPPVIEPESAVRSGLMLRLDVQGPATDESATVSIRARSDGDPFVSGEPLVVECEVQRVAEIDLEPLLQGRHSVAALLIETRHPRLRANSVSVDVDAPIGDDGRRAGTVRAEVRLLQAFSVVGRVAPGPWEMGELRAGLWRWDGAKTSGGPVSHGAVNADGTFELMAPKASRYLVVIAGSQTRPASVPVTTAPAEPRVDAGTIELEAGAAVEGRVTSGGSPPQLPVSFSLEHAIPSHELEWRWTDGDSPLDGLGLADGRVLRRWTDVVTKEDGTFRCPGLEPGVHDVRLHGFSRGHMRAERLEQSVIAPSSNVQIEIALALIRLTLDQPEPPTRPVDGRLELTIQGRDPERIKVEGGRLWGSESAEFVVSPGVPVAFRFEPEVGVPVDVSAVAPAAGEALDVSLALPGMDAVGTLEVRLTGDLPDVGTMFVVHTEPMDVDGPDADFGGFGESGASRVTLAEGGLLTVEGVLAGHVRVLLYPGTWVGHRGSYHLDAMGSATVPAGGTGHVAMNLERGGKLKIGKRNGSGGWSQVPCVVKNAAGEELAVTFTAYAEDGGGAAAARGVITDLAPSLVFPNPAPGRYTVEVAGVPHEVEVRPGETTLLLVD